MVGLNVIKTFFSSRENKLECLLLALLGKKFINRVGHYKVLHEGRLLPNMEILDEL
jgi:hypothetical protein